MFKKTLLCAALIAVSGGATAKATGTAGDFAADGPLTFTGSKFIAHSTEGAKNVVSIPTADVQYALGASYSQGDVLKFTWSQPLIATVAHGPLNIEDGSDSSSSKKIPLTVLSYDSNSVTYRAGAVPTDYNYASATQLIKLTGKNFVGSNQADGTVVTVSYSATTSTGTVIDNGTAAVTVAEIHDQAIVTAVQVIQQVDVEAARKTFVERFNTASPPVAIADSKTKSSMSVVIADDATWTARSAIGTTAGGLVGTAAASTVTFGGDFAWLDNAATAAYDHGAQGSTAPVFDSTTHTATAIVEAVADPSVVEDLVITTAGTVALPTPSYTYDYTYKWTNTATVPAQSKSFTGSLGAWTLNGATITAYGIPNQAAVTPFLWIQNAGTTAGEISGIASCDGASIDLGSLGTASGDTNTTVGVAVQAAIDAAGTCGGGSRYDATLTVNAKASDITITSGYKVQAADGSNDRLSLETSDSLN